MPKTSLVGDFGLWTAGYAVQDGDSEARLRSEVTQLSYLLTWIVLTSRNYSHLPFRRKNLQLANG